MFDKERAKPPQFKTKMNPLLNLQESEPAHFECRLIPVADPTMKVEWFKDGHPIQAGMCSISWISIQKKRLL